MKPFTEKLPLTEDTSFIARTYSTPHFEVPWHQHVEYEIILFLEGAGLSFIGNYIGEFKAGDIFVLGSNLPHTFQKSNGLFTSAVVIQFDKNFWGNKLLDLPESKHIKSLLELSNFGLKITGESKRILYPIIKSIEYAYNFQRVLKLGECLNILAEKREFITVSTQEIKIREQATNERIDEVFQYTITNFKNPIQLSVVAQIANMSVPAFCNYFKKRTKKTFIDFLNEIRIGHACKLLLGTSNSIFDICFDSGFNTVANFNKQFLRVKKVTPSKFRSGKEKQCHHGYLNTIEEILPMEGR